MAATLCTHHGELQRASYSNMLFHSLVPCAVVDGSGKDLALSLQILPAVTVDVELQEYGECEDQVEGHLWLCVVLRQRVAEHAQLQRSDQQLHTDEQTKVTIHRVAQAQTALV